MRPELEKAFNKELRKEVSKGRRKWLLLAAAVVLVLVIYTPVFSSSEYGEVTELSTKERGHVSKIKMEVKLDSGKTITILVDDNLASQAGQRVEVSKMSSVVGLGSYQFVQYVE